MCVFERAGRVWGYDLPEVDVGAAAAVTRLAATHKPEMIINAAAFTDVERAEEDRDAAFRANGAGARHVALAAREAGVPVVYYSTDYVFGGTQRRPYRPQDAVSPIGVYARSKRAGEVATIQAADAHFIIRTAWLYGPGGNNFVEKIVRGASTRPLLRVVDDEVGSPTYTRDLAEATLALCGTAAYGVYHAVNSGSCSRYDFARRIVQLAGLRVPVERCRSSEFPTKAERPLYSVLSNASLEAATGYRMRRWQDALADYMTARQET
jgi:dTDP-4-dehydrorhamnose reductase